MTEKPPNIRYQIAAKIPFLDNGEKPVGNVIIEFEAHELMHMSEKSKLRYVAKRVNQMIQEGAFIFFEELDENGKLEPNRFSSKNQKHLEPMELI